LLIFNLWWLYSLVNVPSKFNPLAILKILISFNHILAGIILLIFHCIDNFYTLNSFWTKEDDINYFSKTLDKGIEENVL
ncbi:DHH family protein, partial [human gut metagenome]